MRIKKLNQEVVVLEKKKSKARVAYLELEGPLSEDFLKDYKSYETRIIDIQNKIKDIQQEVETKVEILERFENIKAFVNELKGSGVININKSIIEIFIEKIIVDADGTIKFIMRDSQIYTHKLNELKEQAKEGLVPFLLPEFKYNIEEYRSCMNNINNKPIKMPLYSYEVEFKTMDKKYWNSIQRKFNIIIEVLI